MSPLGIISDGVAGLHPDPLRYGSVLPLFFGKLSLNSEGLVGCLDLGFDLDIRNFKHILRSDKTSLRTYHFIGD